MPIHLLDTATSLERFTPLAEAGGTPFDGLGLARAYFRSPPVGVRPFVIAVTDTAGHLRGHAAWCLARDRHGLTQLTGVGGADAWFHDPWLAAPEAASQVFDGIVSTLATSRGEWDYTALTLRQAASQPLAAALGTLGPVRQLAVPWRQHRVIALAPGSKRRDGRSEQRGRARLQAVAHRFAAVERHEVPALLRWITALQVARWPEARDWRPYHAFMDQVCQQALATDRLLAYHLTIEGRHAAALVVVRIGEAAYGLYQIYDPAFAAYAPGALLVGWSLEQMTAIGIHSVDTGPGDYAYKARLATGVTATAETLLAGSWRGRLHLAISTELLPMLREQAALCALARFVRPLVPLVRS